MADRTCHDRALSLYTAFHDSGVAAYNATSSDAWAYYWINEANVRQYAEVTGDWAYYMLSVSLLRQYVNERVNLAWRNWVADEAAAYALYYYARVICLITG